MGDSETITPVNQNESSQTGICEGPKPSIDVLKEAKPSENIPAETKKDDSSVGVNIKLTENKNQEEEKPLKNEEQISEDIKTELDKQLDNAIVKNTEKPSGSAGQKRQSDIFGVTPNDDLGSTIFSVGGAPAKTIHQKTLNNSNKTPSNTTIRSSQSRQSQYRNPLTGIGVSSNDEFKNKPTKRKDGNPLLGVGYKDDDEFFNTTQPQRIPPGGYSKGLW